MNIIKISGLVALMIVPQLSMSAAYEDDPQRFYVEGQAINESMEEVNDILCFMSAMRPDALVNDGSYRATIYPEDCETGNADATSEASSATATSASSSTTASAATATVAAAKLATKSLLSVTREDNTKPVKGLAWVEEPSEGEFEPPMMIFVNFEQTASPSNISVNGDLVLNYSAHSNISADETEQWAKFGIEDEMQLGRGVVVASGRELKFRSLGMQSENNVAATFLDSGDKQGIYGEFVGYDTWDYEANAGAPPPDGEDTFVNLIGFFQFYMSKADKGYCRKLLSAETIEWVDGSTAPEEPDEDFDWNAFWEPTRTEVYNSATAVDGLADHEKSGLVATEQCYSSDRAKAQRNVHRYGVYNQDGSRFAIANPGFPIRATVVDTNAEGEEVQVEVYGYADYWGVSVDPMGRALVDGDTKFKKDTFEDDSETTDAETYNIESSDVRIEKRVTSYLPLNDIDGLSYRMHIDDPYWAPQYEVLFGGTPAYKEWEGSFDKETKTFTLTKGLKFQPEYEEVDLETPITFTIAEWQAAMKRTHGEETDEWYSIEIKSMGVWSNDTNLWYDILASGMADPTAASAPTADAEATGMRTETSSFVTPAELTEKLYCLGECLTAAKVQETFTAAVQEGATEVPSPFADVGEYLKSDATVVRAKWGFQSLGEAVDFWDTELATGAANTLKLRNGGVGFTDYVNGDDTLVNFFNGQYYGSEDIDGFANGAQNFFAGDDDDVSRGLSQTNLNKLVGDETGGKGVAPVMNMNFTSLPTEGTGNVTLTVSLIEGLDLVRDSGESILSTSAVMDWESTGTAFTVTMPAATTTTVTLTDGTGTDFSATRTNATAVTVADTVAGKGITWNVFSLLGGNAAVTTLLDQGLGTFFKAGRYRLKVELSTTDLVVAFPDSDDTTQILVVNFRTWTDEDLTESDNYVAGQRYDGLQASEMVIYDASSGVLLDGDGVKLSKGETASKALLSMEEPERALENVVYQTVWGDSRSVAWGLRTGQLFAESDLAKMECRKNGEDQLYDSHPVYGTATGTKRYCSYQLWGGSIQTSYSISLDARPSYSLKSFTTGLAVTIDPPKTLYYTVPETLDADEVAIFGKDAGKRIRLDYRGHGELGGIPGFVYDTKTGEEIGEYVNEWKQDYRYISRFTMPDGSVLEDPTDDTVTYKVKALDGEEWLTKADGSIAGVADLRGRYTYSGSKSDLVANDLLIAPGDSFDTEDYIGLPPTTLLNDGEPSVIHGDVIFDPTPATETP